MAKYGSTARDSYEQVSVILPGSTAKKLHRAAREYRTTVSGVLGMIAAFYFGDYRNHLQCEHCTLAGEYGCLMPEVGEQTTVPLLDKGTVVVGLPLVEQGE